MNTHRFTYGDLKTATLVIAALRGVKRTDGPGLLAIAQEIAPGLEPWEHGVVARCALEVTAECVLVPGP